MKDKRKSLGTGLEALLGKDNNDERERGVVKEIQLNDITPSQYQPRKKMHKETLEELAQSIKQQGVLQPVLVRRQASGSYELVVGERRWRASQVAGPNTRRCVSGVSMLRKTTGFDGVSTAQHQNVLNRSAEA